MSPRAFDPKTNQLTRMEQWDDFSYESGDRKARADRGILEQVENRITLDKHARMWDSTGNTIADRIVLDEKSGNFTAEGHVNTSRLPDQTEEEERLRHAFGRRAVAGRGARHELCQSQ